MATITTFEQAQEALIAGLPNYTRREHQMQLAEVIERFIAEALSGGEPGTMRKIALLAQAGTGTGKSFALAIPAVLSGTRTILATPVKALQNQYIKDMETLKKHLLPDLNYAVLKGRGNYPCYAKIDKLTNPTPVQSQILQRMEELAAPDAIRAMETTDREDFIVTDAEWKPFGMSADECPGAKHCPFGRQCLAERAKARAAAADIVITNTTYLMLDRILALRTGDALSLLGEFGLLIIDEAHTLIDITTDALKDTLGQGSFAVLARDMAAYLNIYDKDVALAEQIDIEAAQLWDALNAAYSEFERQSKDNEPQMPLSINDLLNPEVFGAGIIGVYNAIDAAREEVKTCPVFDDEEMIRRERMLRRSLSLRDRILALATENHETVIRWAEIDGEPGKRRLYVRTAPITVGPFLRSAIWDKTPTILSSATLTTGVKRAGGTEVPDFDYLAGNLGLSQGEAVTYDAGSPFDYRRQALLFVPDKDQPAPDKANRAAHSTWARETTRNMVIRSRGGALLLYTSRKEMEEGYRLLSPSFRMAGLTVLKQGEAPSPELVRQMKADGNAVLFALRTFFQGVDIQGAALRLVILDKLPFAVPSDLIYKARCERINTQFGNEWASFDRLTIPDMILTLVQAAGRLIRHADDMGAIAILDSRLRSKGYGRRILRALPPARQTADPEEACLFLEKIAG